MDQSGGFDLHTLSTRLIAFAAALGVSPADRDDFAQAALLATLEAGATAESPEAYAFGVLRRAVLAARRHAGAGRRAAAGESDPAFVRLSVGAVERARGLAGEDAARTLAALEHVLVWGGRGRTDIALRPGAMDERHEATAVQRLGYYAGLIDALEVTDRQRRRYRAALTELIRAGLEHVRIIAWVPPETTGRVVWLRRSAPDETNAPASAPAPGAAPFVAGLATRGAAMLRCLRVRRPEPERSALAIGVALDWWCWVEPIEATDDAGIEAEHMRRLEALLPACERRTAPD